MMTFQEQIQQYLQPLPSAWRDKITDALVAFKASIEQPTCADFKECETLTSLSPFFISGDTISIAYTDEIGVTVTRSVSLGQVLNNTLDDLDPNCLTDTTTWASMSYTERLQSLINAQCDCCS